MFAGAADVVQEECLASFGEEGTANVNANILKSALRSPACEGCFKRAARASVDIGRRCDE
jgi:hypothetical protein